MNIENTYNQHEELSTGTRLRKAREQLGLSQQILAERLCLKLSIIRDIEEDRVPVGLASTFLRGYIRSYAKLVHIPAEELLPIMDQQALAETSEVLTTQSCSLIKKRSYRKYYNYLISFFNWTMLFIISSLTGIWWWQNYKTQQEEIISITDKSVAKLNSSNDQRILLDNSASLSGGSSESTIITGAQLPTSFEKTKVPSNLEMLSQQRLQSPERNTVTLPSSISVPTTKVSPLSTIPMTTNDIQSLSDHGNVKTTHVDPNELIIKFTADCWLEVIDTTGKKLFSGLRHKDNNLNLIGQAPYNLKIGAPAAVQIQYLRKPVDLKHFITTNQVAHLILN